MPPGIVKFAGGVMVPALGQGTWTMGETPSRRKQELSTIRMGIERGLTVIDTAEMYGDGATERFLGEALVGLRDKVYLISKVYPHNAGGRALEIACESSLKRLRTERLDLYLLHWRGGVPLQATVAGMEALRAAGKIVAWGVSNFDFDDMIELERYSASCAANQVLYNLTRRGPEFDLLPWMTSRAIPLISYSPLEQGRIPSTAALKNVALRHDATPKQIALAWCLRLPGIVAIPKASSTAHLEQNIAAAELTLTAQDLAELDGTFPPPHAKIPLAIL